MIFDCIDDEVVLGHHRQEVRDLFDLTNVAWHGLVDYVRTRHLPTPYEASNMRELASRLSSIAATPYEDSPLLVGIVRRSAANLVTEEELGKPLPPELSRVVDPIVVTLTQLGNRYAVQKPTADEARSFCLRLREQSERHGRRTDW